MAPAPHYASTDNGSDGLMRSTDDYQLAQDNNHDDGAIPMAHESSWVLTDFGQVGERSRDGSIYATDEVFNAASHLTGTMLSILGTVLLVSAASSTQELQDGTEVPPNVWKIVTFSIYGGSLIFLFACSTLHHAVSGPYEKFFRMMDYVAIYPLIGGTFTPLCLVFFHHKPIGWAFCGTVWGIAICGMMATLACFSKIPKWLSMTMYIGLGWMGAGMTYWLIPVLGLGGFGLFLLGGICYTVGGYIFTMERPNPVPGRFGFHEIWHVAVLLGAFLHWLLMFIYVLPANVR